MLCPSPAILTRFLPVGPATLSSNAPDFGGHIFKNEVQTRFFFLSPQVIAVSKGSSLCILSLSCFFGTHVTTKLSER